MPNANSPAEDLAMIRLLTGILLDCGEEWKQSSSYETWKVMFELKKSKMGCNHLCRKILEIENLPLKRQHLSRSPKPHKYDQ